MHENKNCLVYTRHLRKSNSWQQQKPSILLTEVLTVLLLYNVTFRKLSPLFYFVNGKRSKNVLGIILESISKFVFYRYFLFCASSKSSFSFLCPPMPKRKFYFTSDSIQVIVLIHQVDHRLRLYCEMFLLGHQTEEFHGLIKVKKRIQIVRSRSFKLLTF